MEDSCLEQLKEEWKKQLDKDEIENVDIEMFNTQFMKHPSKEDFINWKDDDIANGMTMLQCAIMYGRLDIAKLLLEHGADVNIATRTGGHTALSLASFKGYNDTVKLLVDKGADIHFADDYGRTALMRAVQLGRTKIVGLLLDKGADFKVADDDQQTALSLAIGTGHTNIVKLLLDKGADITVPDEAGRTALMFASDKGHSDIVKLFVDKGADINVADEEGDTALSLALEKGHNDIVKLLLDNGADINIADEDGNTALMRDSERGYDNMVKLLVDNGADITLANEVGETALMFASERGHDDIVKLLVDKGADINIANVDGETALMKAAERGHDNVVKLLLERGADITIADNYEMTALMYALENGHTSMVKFLLDKGADIKNVNIDGDTPLMKASERGYDDIVKLLLDKGADIKITNKDGETALMKASYNGHKEIMKLLLEMGADDWEIILMEWKKLVQNNGSGEIEKVAIQTIWKWLEHPKKDCVINWKDDDVGDGMTLLNCATAWRRFDIVELLLGHGADITVADKDGDTPLMHASKGGQTEVVKLLLDKGADLKIANRKGNTVLMRASANGHVDIVKLLVDKGADITITDNGGTTALMYASRGGHVDVVKLLVNKGADSNVTNNDGMTALMYASQGEHCEIVELLTERSLSRDIGSLLDAGVTIERLEKLYSQEEVQNIVQARIVEQTEEQTKRTGRPSAAVAADVKIQVPPIPNASKIERSQSQDIGTLVDAGVAMEKLEELYPKEEVHKVFQTRIVQQATEEDEMQRHRRGSMARLLFLRSKSTALKKVLRSSAVMDQVLVSLLAYPEEKILICPLMLTPLKVGKQEEFPAYVPPHECFVLSTKQDPVVISSGFVMDRSTALDEKGNLRMQLCPFSRKVLSMPVYPCIPIRSKLKAWEAERMNRCIQVAEKMVESKEWDRVTKVFEIAETLLHEMGDKTYLNLATKLANLERKIPFVENDVERMVNIHQRLIRAAKGDKGESLKLLREAIKDCCKKFGCSILSDDPLMLQESMKTRSAFSKEVLSPTVLINNQTALRDEILELYGLDLALAKKLKSTAAIWRSRRMILGLWETQSGDDDETSKANKTKISEFFKQEGLTGNEWELSVDNKTFEVRYVGRSNKLKRKRSSFSSS